MARFLFRSQPAVERALVNIIAGSLITYKLHAVSVLISPTSPRFWAWMPCYIYREVLISVALAMLVHLACVIRKERHVFRYQRVSTKEPTTRKSWDPEAFEEKQQDQEGYNGPPRQSTSMSGILVNFLSPVLLCLASVLSLATISAMTAYLEGGFIFSWTGFVETLQADREASMGLAGTVLPTALKMSGILAFTTTVASLIHCSALRQLPLTASKVRSIFALSAVLATYIIIVHTPKALPKQDLLSDGIRTYSWYCFRQSADKEIDDVENTATIYAPSNIDSPKKLHVNAADVKHVFLVLLESTDEFAWPYQPDKFCSHRNCLDIPEELNTVDEITPFFSKLVKESYFVPPSNFQTTVAFSSKSEMATLCGQYPAFVDMGQQDADSLTPQACLPHLLKDSDPNWRSGFFFPGELSGGSNAYMDVLMDHFGYNASDVFSKHDLDQDGKTRTMVNRFGYAEGEIIPMMFDWIDQQTAEPGARVFATLTTLATHEHWGVPDDFPKKQYTSTVDASNYLNTVKYADQQLERLYDGLKERGLLDSSLFIVQGDHGARIGLQGYQVQEHHGRNLRAPWVVRPPGGSRIALDLKPYALWNSLDVVPTILDALGFQESVISSYPGSSLLRPLHAAESTGYRHQTYHVHNPGGRWPTVQQGPYKLILMYNILDKHGKPTPCAVDISVDPEEEYLWCFEGGWREVMDPQTGAVTTGQALYHGKESWLQNWAKSKLPDLKEHLKRNNQIWGRGGAGAEENAEAQELHRRSMRILAKKGKLFKQL